MIISALKIILFVILSVILLALILLLILLLVPFRYILSGKYEDDKPEGSVYVSYLCRLVVFKLLIRGPGDFEPELSVFGIKCRLNRNDKDDSGTVNEEMAKVPETSETQATQPAAKTSKIAEDLKIPDNAEKIENIENKENEENKENNENNENKEDSKLKKFIDIYNEIRLEKNASAIKLLKKEVFCVLKSIAPKKGCIKVTYGAGDPFKTAEVLQYLAVAYAFLGDTLDVTPDFSGKIFNLNADCRGRIFLIVPVVSFLKLYKDKTIRQYIKK